MTNSDREELRRLASSDSGVKVRELEWIEREGVEGTFDARSIFGAYWISEYPGSAKPFKLDTHLAITFHDNLDAAKAAAQADYEARIKSAPVEVPAVKGEPVAWRWRGVHSNGPYTFSEVRPEHHPDYATEPLYLGPVSVEDAIRNTFAEITSKAIAVSDPTSDDPERVRHYIVPVGPMHRAAGNIGYQMFDGDRLLAAASADALKYHAALIAIRDQTQHSYDFPVQSDDAFDLAVDNVIRMVHETALKALADHITAPPADAGMREAYSALCLPRESQASDNLEGALYDIERLSAQGKPTDDICIRTLKRVLKQIARAEQALTAPGATTKSDGGGESRPALKEERIETTTVHEDRTTSLAAVRQKAGVAPGPSDPSSTRNEVTVENVAYQIRRALVEHYPAMNGVIRESVGDAAARALLDQFEIRRKK